MKAIMRLEKVNVNGITVCVDTNGYIQEAEIQGRRVYPYDTEGNRLDNATGLYKLPEFEAKLRAGTGIWG